MFTTFVQSKAEWRNFYFEKLLRLSLFSSVEVAKVGLIGSATGEVGQTAMMCVLMRRKYAMTNGSSASANSSGEPGEPGTGGSRSKFSGKSPEPVEKRVLYAVWRSAVAYLVARRRRTGIPV